MTITTQTERNYKEIIRELEVKLNLKIEAIKVLHASTTNFRDRALMAEAKVNEMDRALNIIQTLVEKN